MARRRQCHGKLDISRVIALAVGVACQGTETLGGALASDKNHTRGEGGGRLRHVSTRWTRSTRPQVTGVRRLGIEFGEKRKMDRYE